MDTKASVMGVAGLVGSTVIKLQMNMQHLSFISFISVCLVFLRTDISGIDQVSLFNLIIHISLLFTVISLTPIFILFDL